MVNSEGPPAAHALGVVRPSPIAGSSSHRAAGVVTSVISGPALPSPADQQAHGHQRDDVLLLHSEAEPVLALPASPCRQCPSQTAAGLR